MENTNIMEKLKGLLPISIEIKNKSWRKRSVKVFDWNKTNHRRIKISSTSSTLTIADLQRSIISSMISIDYIRLQTKSLFVTDILLECENKDILGRILTSPFVFKIPRDEDEKDTRFQRGILDKEITFMIDSLTDFTLTLPPKTTYKILLFSRTNKVKIY